MPAEERYTPSSTFQPHRVTRNGHVQTLLARRIPPDSVAVRMEQPMIVDAGEDETGFDPDHPVRLLGYYNPPLRHTSTRGFVIILHGWQGSSHSADALLIADTLLRAGYATFRLNARDHGPRRPIVDPYALNRGLFLGTLLNEIATAIRRVTPLASGAPVSVVGGSMGGNLALRVAALHTHDPFPDLTRVIAVCPAISPTSSFNALDAQPAYRAYFRARWLSALMAKERDFPDTYNFAPLRSLRRINDMTDWLIPRFSSYTDRADYYSRFTVTPALAETLRVPTTIIAARNDAIVPFADFLEFEPNDYLDIHIHATGGHMGFVDIFPYRRWLPGAVVALLEGRDPAAA